MFSFSGRSSSYNGPHSFLSNSVSNPRHANLQTGSFWDIIPLPCNVLTADNQLRCIPSAPHQVNQSFNYQSFNQDLLNYNSVYLQEKTRISGVVESDDEDDAEDEDNDDDDDDDSDDDSIFEITHESPQKRVSPKAKIKTSKRCVGFNSPDKRANLKQNKQNLNIERSYSKYEDSNLHESKNKNLTRGSLDDSMKKTQRLKVNRSPCSNTFEEKENKSVSIKKRKTQTDEITIPKLQNNVNKNMKNNKRVESNIPVKRNKKRGCVKQHEEEDETMKSDNCSKITTVDFFGEHHEFQQSSTFEEMVFHEPQAGISSTCAIRAKNTSCGYIHISSNQCITSETTSSITIMVLSGSLNVINNEKSCIVNEGAFIYIPSDVPYSLKNNTDKEVRLSYFKSN